MVIKVLAQLSAHYAVVIGWSEEEGSNPARVFSGPKAGTTAAQGRLEGQGSSLAALPLPLTQLRG
jgi:hypothetical protein